MPFNIELKNYESEAKSLCKLLGTSVLKRSCINSHSIGNLDLSYPNRPATRYIIITQAEWSKCPIQCIGNNVWLTQIFMTISTVNPDICRIIGQIYVE